MSIQPQPDPQESPTPSCSLAELEKGERGVVVEVDAATPVGRRLLDLGFVPRTPVTVVRNAPLGDPVEYEVRGTRFCLRRAEARLVQVRPE
jgi:Fe2+ transport system protein FeoA